VEQIFQPQNRCNTLYPTDISCSRYIIINTLYRGNKISNNRTERKNRFFLGIPSLDVPSCTTVTIPTELPDSLLGKNLLQYFCGLLNFRVFSLSKHSECLHEGGLIIRDGKTAVFYCMIAICTSLSFRTV